MQSIKTLQPILLSLSLFFGLINAAKAQQYLNFGQSQEEEQKERATKVQDLKESFKGFQVDFIPAYYQYTEPNVMKLKGINYRGGAEYTFFLKENSTWLMHIDYSFAYGKINYSSYGTGAIKGQSQIVNELKINVGKATYFASHPFKYYWGLGFRQLDHDGRGTSTTGHYGYKRRSQYFLISGGYEWLIPLSNSWDFRLKNEIALMPYGRQTSYSARPTDSTSRHNQHFGANFRLAPNFAYSKRLIVGPYIDLWYVAESERNYEGGGWYSYEPENNTVELGLLVGLRF